MQKDSQHLVIKKISQEKFINYINIYTIIFQTVIKKKKSFDQFLKN